MGRVCDPTPDCPWAVSVRPWVTGGIMVEVGDRVRLVETQSMDDPRVEDAVAELIGELRIGCASARPA